MNSRFRHILITGASSGIGRALALAYAAEGRSLTLFARNQERLHSVVEDCERKGAQVNGVIMDIADRSGMDAAIRDADAALPLDLVIANAGVARNREDAEFSRELVGTNILGTLNTVEPAVDLMSNRGRGQIALMSSLAAFRAFGGPPGYAASKAWIRLYGEAMRGRLARKGVGVSVICPGFVRTPMTASVEVDEKWIMSAERAALLIQAGLEENIGHLSFPKSMAYRIWLASMLPSWWTDRSIKEKWSAAQTGSKNSHGEKPISRA